MVSANSLAMTVPSSTSDKQGGLSTLHILNKNKILNSVEQFKKYKHYIHQPYLTLHKQTFANMILELLNSTTQHYYHTISTRSTVGTKTSFTLMM